MIELKVRTSKREYFVDIFDVVSRVCKLNNWIDLILDVFISCTTCGVKINENTDPNVSDDMTKYLISLITCSSFFSHSEGNSDMHIKTFNWKLNYVFY